MFTNALLAGLAASLSLSGVKAVKPMTASIKEAKPVAEKKFDLAGLEGKPTLRILNWEDYIYIKENPKSDAPASMVDQFKQYVKEVYGVDITIDYATSDTNETMLNELATGKSNFDLLCPSDYGIQKLMAMDKLEPIVSKMTDLGLNNYKTYVSRELLHYLEGIQAKNKVTGEMLNFADYGVGYLWGTLGIIFNPDFAKYSQSKKDFSPSQMMKDMTDWESLWSPYYYGGISVKDSIRDTYFIALAKNKKQEILNEFDSMSAEDQAKFELYPGEFKENLIDLEHPNHALTKQTITAEVFKEGLNKKLNLSDAETTKVILQELKGLKKNIYGLEVDSGKQDIVTGKVGINTAWSGDAIFAMDSADEFNEAAEVVDEFPLHYAIPKPVANIWFDGWCMPKDPTRTPMQEALACLFIDFICDPLHAAQNTDYIGYTSFIGGDYVIDLMKDWYDARTEGIYYTDETSGQTYSLYYPQGEEYHQVWYNDYHEEENTSRNSIKTYYPILDNDNGGYVFEDETLVPYSQAKHQGQDRYTLKEHGSIADLVIDETWDKVDLTYFFKDTTVKYQDPEDLIFYAVDYYAKDENKKPIPGCGRQFYCQYPDAKTIERCVIMADYGDNNKNVVKMWEEFKVNDIQPWMYVTFSVIVGAIVAGALYITISKSLNKRLRKKRRAQEKA